jgi:hypothetical protein
MTTRNEFLTMLVFGTTPAWALPVGSLLAHTPWAVTSGIGAFLLLAGMSAGVLCLPAGCLLLASPLLALDREYRRNALAMGAGSALTLAAGVGGLVGYFCVLDYNLTRLETRNQPVADAIHAFETAHGRPPETLGELVPDYLPELPHSGIGMYPEVEYVTGQPKRTAGNA